MNNINKMKEDLSQYKDGQRHAREIINEAWPYAAAPARSLCDDMDGSPYGEGLAVGTYYAMAGSGHMYVSQAWVESLHDKWSKVAAEIAAATPPPPPLTRAEARAVLEAFDRSGADSYEPFLFETHVPKRTPEQQDAVDALRATARRFVKENPEVNKNQMASHWTSESMSGSLAPMRAWAKEDG